jgi:hypothetical protein
MLEILILVVMVGFDASFLAFGAAAVGKEVVLMRTR